MTLLPAGYTRHVAKHLHDLRDELHHAAHELPAPAARSPSLVPRWLRAGYEWLVIAGGFALVGVIGVGVTIISAVLIRILSRRAGNTVGQRVIHWFFRVVTGYMTASRIVRLDLTDLDRLEGAGPLLLAPNHPSLLDAVFVVSRLTRVVCVMKADVHRNPALGGGARLAGYIDNATMPRMIRGAIAALGDGRRC